MIWDFFHINIKFFNGRYLFDSFCVSQYLLTSLKHDRYKEARAEMEKLMCVCASSPVVHKRNNIKTAEKKTREKQEMKKNTKKEEQHWKIHQNTIAKKSMKCKEWLKTKHQNHSQRTNRKKHRKKHLPSRKLTWQCRIHHLKMYFLLKMVIFQCHVSFRGCKNTGRFGTTTSTLFKTRSFRHQR